MLTVTTIEQFEHLMLTHYNKTFILVSTPDIARYILEKYNLGNRSIRPKNVERIARLMKGGHWKCTRGTMPLRFDKSGRLFGGQHRLHGVIVSDMTISFYVMLELDEDLRDIEDDVSPHQNQDNDRTLTKEITAISRALTGIKFGTDEQRRFYAHYKDAIDGVRSMFGNKPGVRVAGVLAEFVKAFEIVPVGKLKYIARVLTNGLPENRRGDAVIIKLRDMLLKDKHPDFVNANGKLEYWPKIQSVIQTIQEDRNPRSIVPLEQPVYALEGDVLEIIKNKND